MHPNTSRFGGFDTLSESFRVSFSLTVEGALSRSFAQTKNIWMRQSILFFFFPLK